MQKISEHMKDEPAAAASEEKKEDDIQEAEVEVVDDEDKK